MTEQPERPPIATSPISAVLPFHNAEAFLEAAVGAWTAHLNGLKRDYELVLVDDGSTDRTPELAEALAKRQGSIRVLRQPVRSGIGAALRTAVPAASHPLLVCTDFNDPYPVVALDRMLELIDHVDLVSGYRAWDPPPGLLHVPGRFYRWLTRTIFGVESAPREFLARLAQRWSTRVVFAVRLSDVACGFRLFRRSIFERMPIQSDGPFAQIEILAKANYLGCLMTEVPVAYRPRGGAAESEPPHALRQILAEARRVFSQPTFGPGPPG